MSTINVGINGFGRIGKCCFMQLFEDDNICIKAININNLEIKELEQYLNNDTIHGKRKYKVECITENVVRINQKVIYIFKSKNAKEIDWLDWKVDYLFETTGAYLTTEKATEHKAKYICMSAPPKDLGTTPIYCYGVNDSDYKGDYVISTASCTTNCIAPFLKTMQKYEIVSSNFITIHSATSSQSVVDTANFNKRTNRSIFNNIIPHTTGATSSLQYILPDLYDKVVGTSVRIPTSNVSMIDVNITFKNKITKEQILTDLEKLQNDVLIVNKEKLVSSDFIGTTHPTIVDYYSTFQIDENSVKFTLWYDNEWSYAAQMIKMVKVMYNKNNQVDLTKISNINCYDKVVAVRCDFNCPVNSEGIITDDYRIKSTLPTLDKILLDKPKKLILMTHYGRPKNKDQKYSTKIFIKTLQSYLRINNICFLENGFCTTNEELHANDSVVCLMENVRFHDFETTPNNVDTIHFHIDIFCNEAFSASHRDHYSITRMNTPIHCYGYCFIKEIETFNMILKNNGGVITAIIGGSKVNDKMPMLEKLSTIVDYIFVAGNNLNSIQENSDFFNKISTNKAKIVYASDGFGNIEPNAIEHKYFDSIMDPNCIHNNKIFDIGPKSINQLAKHINKSNIVFWNGGLGICEDSFYKNGSETLIHLLNTCKAKVIIGGGDTAGFVNQYENRFHHISTGGGASIDYISNSTLPGLLYK